MDTDSVKPPLDETRSFRIFQLKLLHGGRSEWSPQKWAAVVKEYIKSTGQLNTKQGRVTYKICNDILRASKTGNIFKDWE